MKKEFRPWISLIGIITCSAVANHTNAENGNISTVIITCMNVCAAIFLILAITTMINYIRNGHKKRENGKLRTAIQASVTAIALLVYANIMFPIAVAQQSHYMVIVTAVAAATYFCVTEAIADWVINKYIETPKDNK